MPDCTSAPGDLSVDVKTGQKLDATRQVDLTSVQCMQLSAESTAVSSNGCCTCEFLVVSIEVSAVSNSLHRPLDVFE